uniref:Uncharacterized protein n=1 Tax=Callorhinchus milii TaxID=7868 RepID=A0A4W3IGK9_CALMI
MYFKMAFAFSRRQQHMGAKGKSREELKMEKISQFQKEFAEQRKLNEETLKAAICGTSACTEGKYCTKAFQLILWESKKTHRHGEQSICLCCTAGGRISTLHTIKLSFEKQATCGRR